ncbi:MAG: RHS repeat-associated core domain-containing protein [gamma proteobacterium symbiont of Bathyaustriella thionipta]|nr:RHS repeat-associated core domain-containing protein [gamma proteobacterium symbiont of Bathyaustriella thionipta]MCU7949574.1 RHS repeat-associated core domain-containing protein [gamma proteobacterium symbiont of Bathyaustriella thionipta]MCU7952939.1 RHS repeat-associated core domain-containing protein [gamma proteobacterium symbiont of Bathyaustriella thionipta]MCU7956166.1 RHS repeat-associated core domain-containing protein [gamma proteobacterium symbiont of Bathyaustriella thionipta]M
MSDNAGNTQGSTRYGVFGQGIASAGNQPLFGFTGREPDTTGLTFYRNRYYDPSVGRFTQRDPLGFADGINPYTYVSNSPTNFTDPLGLSKQSQSIMGWVSSAWDGITSTGIFSQDNRDVTSNMISQSRLGNDCGTCHSSSQLNQMSQLDSGAMNNLISSVLPVSAVGTVGTVGRITSSLQGINIAKGVRYGPTNLGPLNSATTATFISMGSEQVDFISHLSLKNIPTIIEYFDYDH